MENLLSHITFPLPWAMALGGSLLAALWDLSTQRIPNALTAPLAALGFLAAYLLHGSLVDSFLGMLVMATPYLMLFIFCGGGGGDVKLMAALGSCLGVYDGLRTLFWVAILGAVVGLIYALMRRRLAPVLSHLRSYGVWLIWRAVLRVEMPAPSSGDLVAIPYGLSIFLGTLVAAAGRFL